jgi:hypothetical protein
MNVINIINEEIENLFETEKNYNKFPLSALVKQAKNFKNFEDFEHLYSINIYHGYYWHWTDNSNFKISNIISPRDMSSMSDGGGGNKGAIMLTSDMNYWDAHYNQHEKGKIIRPYAILFNASDIEPRYLNQISRGFGNEIYLYPEQAQNLKQIGVYNRNTAKAIERRMHAMIPHSKEELYELWKSTQNNNIINSSKNNNNSNSNNIIREEINNISLDPNVARSSGLSTKLVYLSIDKSYANAYANGETSAAHVYRFPIKNGVLFYICLPEDAEHYGGDVWTSGFKNDIIEGLTNYLLNPDEALETTTEHFLDAAQYDIESMTSDQIKNLINLFKQDNLSMISPLNWSDLQEREQGYSEVCVKKVTPNEIIKIEIYQNGEIVKTIKGNYSYNCEIPFYHGSPLAYWQHLLK